MKPIVSTIIAQTRIAKWITQAKPVDKVKTWTETRRVIDIGEHTYLVESDQVFQCTHCGRYDPKWDIAEVLEFLYETYGAKPYDIEITCTVAEK